jgi:hypothetical protein
MVLALLMAQTLGLVHGVAHSPVQHVAHVASAQHDDPAHGLIDTLFSGHGSDADCRLYDQLSHGDTTACVPAVILPLLLPAALFAYFQGEAVARHAALFEARAPPPVR